MFLHECHEHNESSTFSSQNHCFIISMSHVELKGPYFNEPLWIQKLSYAQQQTA